MIAVFVEAADGLPEHPSRHLAHLEACEDCARRYEAIMRSLGDLRDQATAEADEMLSPERLETQRAQILDRLTHVFNPARVLPFPVRPSSYLSHATTRQVHRWVAVAAAAGLVIGIGVGRVSGVVTSRPSDARLDRPAVTAPVRPVQTKPLPAGPRLNDEEVVAQADRPPHLGEDYEVLDAITPHVTLTAAAMNVR